MNVLGFDASTAAVSACALRADGRAAERLPDADELLGRPAHGRELMPVIVAVLAEAELAFDDLDLIAVSRGPGSFTGVRIALATALGLGHAHGTPVRGVSSLAALAVGARAERETGSVLALIDARRGELFAALYAGGQELWAPQVIVPAELVERLDGLPEAPLAVGDGSLRSRAMLEAAGVRVAPHDSPLHGIRGLWVCRLAAESGLEEPPTPLYLREPDARPIA